ncbi:hypothetical protein F5Y14DRAFT_150827 [Nemania sp. NC0429]|nr:hypothetical protein F5Y14DRAFT_150827 [Nemania sp. NC0429]
MMARLFAFGTDLWDPSHRFQTSWLVSPWVLFGIRALLALYAFTTIFVNIGYACAHASEGGCETARNGFSFFTVLSYWGLASYLFFAALHTFFYALRGRALLDDWPRPLQWLHGLLCSTATTFPFLVVIIFWGLLAAPTVFATPFSAWGNISEHALNGVFAFVEIILPRTSPAPWTHLPFLLLLLALYLALAYVTRATKGFYTYTFLDPGLQGPLVAAYVFGIAAGISVLFALLQGIVWLRRWITEDKLGFDGVFAHAGALADEEEAGRRARRGAKKSGEVEHGLEELQPAD